MKMAMGRPESGSAGNRSASASERSDSRNPSDLDRRPRFAVALSSLVVQIQISASSLNFRGWLNNKVQLANKERSVRRMSTDILQCLSVW